MGVIFVFLLRFLDCEMGLGTIWKSHDKALSVRKNACIFKGGYVLDTDFAAITLPISVRFRII